MLYKEFIEKVKPEFEKALAFLSGELAKIRTSHASPALVEDVQVDYLGQKYALKQLAAISTPQTNQIVIQPWDGSYIQSIEQAVLKSGLGMSAAVDGSLIRFVSDSFCEDSGDWYYGYYNQKCAKISYEGYLIQFVPDNYCNNWISSSSLIIHQGS